MERRPNLVLILLDDMGWRDLSCYGSAFYETPRIDRLAAQGMRFTQAYAACPVCSPSRASLLTGRYPARVGVTDWIGAHRRGKVVDAPYVDHLPLSETSLARAFREGGYQTWHVGKWHLGGRESYPDRHGFDVNVGGCQWGHPVNGYFAPWGIENLPEGAPGTYLTDHLTDEAIRLVRNRGDRPFFLNFWHYAVHTPIQAPAADVAHFEAKARRLRLTEIDPLVVGEEMPFDSDDGVRRRVTRRVVQSHVGYAAMLRNLDANVGRLLDELDAQGIADDTVVVFTSDNGGLSTSEGAPTCNAPLSEGKGWTAEGGIREPLFIRHPGRIRPGGECPVPVTTPDLYPTLLELCGLPPRPAQHVDGVSLVPLLEGRVGAEGWAREALFWHYPHYGNQGGTPSAAVRWKAWKLIRYFEDERVELFDLSCDISESTDLAPREPDLADRLAGLLADWLGEVGARFPERA